MASPKHNELKRLQRTRHSEHLCKLRGRAAEDNVGELQFRSKVEANMECFSLPVRYQELTETDVQAHLRYGASSLADGDRIEFFLYEAGVVIPIVKHIYRRKNPTLDVLIRSGSLGRDTLAKLRDSLSSEGYALKVSLTNKRKLLSRIVVPLQIDDGTVAMTGLNVLRSQLKR